MKERVDRLLVQRGLAPSRTRARALVESGKVRVGGVPVARPSDTIDVAAALTVERDHPYVSRGGLKLEGALADLTVDVHGAVLADVGASTGGFTDCALRAGAARVYAIDVGHDQLHPSLRVDPRVIAQEGVNARYLTASSLPEPVDLVVVDASFIGLGKLLPALAQLVRAEGRVLALVKPQFEVGPERVGRRGVVDDDALRDEALQAVIAAAADSGLAFVASADSRVPGPQGNREIFALFVRDPALRAVAPEGTPAP